MSAPHHKTSVRINGWTKRVKRLALLLLLGTVVVSMTAAAATVAGAANATQPSTHPIQYWIGCAPSMVTTTTLDYFKDQGFTAVVMVVPDSQTYQTQLNTIKSLNMLPIIDIEMPIWDGGQLQSTPISNFAGYFQSLQNAGWQYVASEGGRPGDLAFMQNYFQGYVNFNCDQCGLWEGGNPVYTNPFTVANSWESYYPSEWPYIQTGSQAAAALGIQNGLLAGTWANSGGDNQIYANSVSGSGTPSYKSMLDWSYANGIGFTSFQVWCGDNPDGLSQYQSLGFDKIVANLQQYYPPTSSAAGLGWSRIGGQLASGTGPAASAQNASSLDVFAEGMNGGLFYTSSQGSGWSAWDSLGGTLTSSPAVTSRNPGGLTVFVRGTDGTVYYRDYVGGSWGPWASIGGQTPAGSAPAVASWGSGRLDVFVKGINGGLYQKTYTPTGGWSGWQYLGGTLTSGPGATSRNPGGLTVFVRGTDGRIWYRDYVAGSWGPWASIGGQVAANTGPAACSYGGGSLDVFVQGISGAAYQMTYTSTGGWSRWQPLGGGLTSSPAAASPAYGVTDVFVRGTDGAVWEHP